ncbi:MAG: protein YgfX [Steroidobacter sp.]
MFEPRWSWQRAMVFIAQCVMCGAIPWLLPYWPVGVCLLVSAVTLAVLILGYRHLGWWGPRRVLRVTWQQSGQWLLQLASSKSAGGWVLTERSRVMSWLMVLRWRDDESCAQVIIFPGELPRAEWRRWQARLKLQAAAQTPVTMDG